MSKIYKKWKYCGYSSLFQEELRLILSAIKEQQFIDIIIKHV